MKEPKVDFYQIIQRRRISLQDFFEREGILIQAQYFLWREAAESKYTFSDKFEEELKKVKFADSLEVSNVSAKETTEIFERKVTETETISEDLNVAKDLTEIEEQSTLAPSKEQKRTYKKKVQTEEESDKIEE